VDLASLLASLSIFNMTSMDALRAKSVKMTAYLEHLLIASCNSSSPQNAPYQIITPMDPEVRGAQLSILLRPGLLRPVFKKMSDDGFVFDQRNPDVIRIAPVPLYNSFEDVWKFVRGFQAALAAAAEPDVLCNGAK
jgi:kynureninase